MILPSESESPLTRCSFGDSVLIHSTCSVVQVLPVQMTWCILFGVCAAGRLSQAETEGQAEHTHKDAAKLLVYLDGAVGDMKVPKDENELAIRRRRHFERLRSIDQLDPRSNMGGKAI